MACYSPYNTLTSTLVYKAEKTDPAAVFQGKYTI